MRHSRAPSQRPKSVLISEEDLDQTSGEKKSAETDDVTAHSLANVDPNDANASHIAMSASLDGGLTNLAEATDAAGSSSIEESKSVSALPALDALGEGVNFPSGRDKDPIGALEATQEKLIDEERKIGLELSHIHKDESRMLDIKEADRALYGRERSREIERKRRLLTKEEGVRKGNPPVEAQNAYDWYAKKCQSVIRGWLARCYYRWFKEASRKASTIIQATARGKLGRLRVKGRKCKAMRRHRLARFIVATKHEGWGQPWPLTKMLLGLP